MNKKIALMAAAFITAAPFSTAFAQEAVTQITTDTTQTKVRTIPRGDRAQVKVDLRDENQQTRQEIAIERADLKQQRNDLREEKTQDRCKNIQTRIDSQTKRYENSKNMFVTVFGNMKARLTRLSERLATKGIDVTKLNADIAALDTMIGKLTTDQDAFVASLSEANTNATTNCATTPTGQFMGKLLGARKIAQTVEQDRIAIRSFFQTTIKPDIMALRQQIADQNKDTAKSEADEQETATKTDQTTANTEEAKTTTSAPTQTTSVQ